MDGLGEEKAMSDDMNVHSFNELKAESEVLASRICDMKQNLDSLSRNLDSLMDCAGEMFPEAYENYLKNKASEDKAK